MRIFKIILFLLALLVIGLVIFQVHLTVEEEFSPEDEPGFVSPQVLTNSRHSSKDSLAASVFAVDTDPRPSTRALISGSEATDFVWTSQTPAARRVRQIFPDTEWMTPEPVLKEGDVITLALFDDAVFEAKISDVTVYPNGAVGMTAHLTGDEHGTVFLSYSEQQMRASVEVPGGADYYCRYDPETDAHYAIEVDPEKTIIRPCGGDLMAPPSARGPIAGSAELNMASAPVAAADSPTGATIIDVMIVYTPAALAHEGNNEENMNENIALAMQRANEAHANSNTRIELRLVHSAEVDYTESGNDYTDLNRLTNPNDEYMDELHDWRDQYGADFICLFSDTAFVGGVGWLMTSDSGEPDTAFCLASVWQTDTGYTVVHEWGHNMGCSHSKTQSLEPWEPNNFRSYSAGWQWEDTASSRGGYCTVMTYVDADNNGIPEYTWVGHFSNPDINYTGNSTNPTGDAQDGDNARTMREMRGVYAGYRISSFMATMALPYTNDFEESLDDWTPDSGGASWFRNSGDDQGLVMASNGGYSGTLQAHSGDFFLMFDAENNQGTNACLDAQFDLSGYDEVSLSFWYHMERKFFMDVGDLTLQVTTGISSEWIDMWSGSRGEGWRKATVDLSVYAGLSQVRVRFLADIGSPDEKDWYYSYILLDDITVMEPLDENRTDLDNDGLPNEWELQYFGSETGANPAVIAANGVNTVMEAYIAGLNPTDPSAWFSESLAKTNGFVVSWNAVSGRVYSVLGSADLENSFQPLETNILWPQNSWTDTVEHSEQFYQVDVELE